MIKLRIATPEDAGELLAIYEPYIKKTAVTFEYETPTESEFRERIAGTLARYPYLVAERGGAAVGYAYASPLGKRTAYQWACESSVYVSEGARGGGVGSALCDALETLLREMGEVVLYACISLPNDASVSFHAARGYAGEGHFRNCGCKFGVWHDVVWMAKQLAERHTDPREPIPFPQLGRERVNEILLSCGSAKIT